MALYKLCIRHTIIRTKPWHAYNLRVYLREKSIYIVIDVEEFLEMYKRAQQLPTEKLQYPMTEAQEIGWDTTPLVSYHVCSEVLHSNSTRTL